MCKPQTLQIAAIQGEGNASKSIHLQVGDWFYTLVPGVSPCFRTGNGGFILPDVHSDVPGSSVGIILSSYADESVYEILENILLGIVRPRGLPEPHTLSETISNGMITGGYCLSKGLITGAQAIGSLLNYGTPKIMQLLSPATEDTEIPPTVIQGFETASNATKTVSEFTGYVADKVGNATQALGRFLAPHIQTQGTQLLTTGFNFSEGEASSTMNSVLTLAAGAIEGFSTVYTGLETSASILGKNLSNNTVKVVQHTYGGSAGHLATNTFDTMGNVITIGRNSRFLTPKGIVKTAARETGKAIVKDVMYSQQHQINFE